MLSYLCIYISQSTFFKPEEIGSSALSAAKATALLSEGDNRIDITRKLIASGDLPRDFVLTLFASISGYEATIPNTSKGETNNGGMRYIPASKMSMFKKMKAGITSTKPMTRDNIAQKPAKSMTS